MARSGKATVPDGKNKASQVKTKSVHHLKVCHFVSKQIETLINVNPVGKAYIAMEGCPSCRRCGIARRCGIQSKPMAWTTGRRSVPNVFGVSLQKFVLPSSPDLPADIQSEQPKASTAAPIKSSWPQWAQIDTVEWPDLESTDQIHIEADVRKRNAVKEAFRVNFSIYFCTMPCLITKYCSIHGKRMVCAFE